MGIGKKPWQSSDLEHAVARAVQPQMPFQCCLLCFTSYYLHPSIGHSTSECGAQKHPQPTSPMSTSCHNSRSTLFLNWGPLVCNCEALSTLVDLAIDEEWVVQRLKSRFCHWMILNRAFNFNFSDWLASPHLPRTKRLGILEVQLNGNYPQPTVEPVSSGIQHY